MSPTSRSPVRRVSSEDLLNAYHSPADDPSPNSSGNGTPSGQNWGKKHVNWILPNDDGDAEAEEAGPSTDRGDAKFSMTVQPTDSPEDGADPEADEGLERTYTREQLSAELHRIFSEPNSAATSPGADASDPSQPPRGRSPQPGDRSAPPRARSPQPPKSVLRKGHVTPGGSEVYSPPTNEEEKRYDARKTEAAADARQKAHWWSKSVDTSPEPPVKRRKPGKDSNRAGLYHEGPITRSGDTTPDDLFDYVPKPDRYRVSGLSAIGLLEKFRSSRHNSFDSTEESGNSTPGFRPKLFPRSPRGSPRGSVNSLGIGDLIQSSSAFGGYGYSDIGTARRPTAPRTQSSSSLPYNATTTVRDTISKISRPWKSKTKEEIRIKKHIQQTISRQRYLLKLCQALMQYGAPTHRLEEYMKMSARVLETEAQFLYIPGCMIISYDDSRSHTTEVKLVRCAQGIDLGRIRDTHDVYKDVVHDHIGVEEATQRLDDILNHKEKFNKWLRVGVYGLASVGVGPFAFSARLIDLPIAFVLGCILGILQLIIAPSSELYSNVFEIISVIITSFLARAFGSIRGGDLFCFSALAQSSIALILPGYIVLTGSLELQSRSIVAGSVRLVYAIIYSLFIGYGLTIGTAIYGAIDSNASSETVCKKPLSDQGYWIFFFVPLFAVCLMVINQAKWKQMPVMTVIAFSGYLVSYFSSNKFIGNAQVTSSIAALAIGIMANTYSRVGVVVDSTLCKPFEWIWKMVLLVTCQPRDSSTKLSPSRLENQKEKEDDPPKSRSAINRLSAFLHNGEHESGPSTTSHSSHTSTPSNELEDHDDHNDHHHEDHDEEKEKEKKKKHDKLHRVRYSLASAAMLPAIFVLVPSGLSVSGSLVQGIASADQLIKNSQSNGGVTTASEVTTGNFGNGLAFNVGYSVVQVAIGITVGLFLGSLVVYPFGKGGKVGKGKNMRSGLFSF